MNQQTKSNKYTNVILKSILVLVFSAPPVFAATLRMPCESSKLEDPSAKNTETDLSVWRAQGLIGELDTGYVEALDKMAQATVDKINLNRKEIYNTMAEKYEINIEGVGRTYAKKIFESVPAGTWIKIDEEWAQKK